MISQAYRMLSRLNTIRAVSRGRGMQNYGRRRMMRSSMGLGRGLGGRRPR